MTEERPLYGEALICPVCHKYPRGHSAEQCLAVVAAQRDMYRWAYIELWRLLLARIKGLQGEERIR